MSDLTDLVALEPPTLDEPTERADAAPLGGLYGVVGLVASPAQAKMRAAVAWMRPWIGTTEKPAGSNRVPFWDDVRPSFQGEPWCAAFGVDAYLHQGIDFRRLFGDGNAFYCPTWRTMAIKRGVWRNWDSGYAPQVGDIGLLGRGALPYHFVTAAPDLAASYSGYRSIEGNTSPGASGSQSNGGGVYRRDRALSSYGGWVDVETLIGQMAREGLTTLTSAPGVVASSASAPARPQFSLGRLLQGVHSGEASGNVRIVQDALHRRYSQTRYPGKPDGRWTTAETVIYRAFQRDSGWSGVDADGIPGVASLGKLLPGYEVIP